MKLFSSLRSISSVLFRRSRMERDMDEEFRAHIANRAEDLMRSGLSRAEAERRARIEFGGYQKYKEEIRESLGAHFLETLAQDIRYAFRMLRKSPGFTAVAVLTLALGIGANTAIFSVFDAVGLRPLPLPHASTLMRLERSFQSGAQGGVQYLFSWREYEYVSSQTHSFPRLIAVSPPLRISGILPSGDALHSAGIPQRVVVQMATANYFSALDVQPSLGRAFAANENDAPSAHPVAVASYSFWRGRLNSDSAILGKIIKLNGAAFTIIGVAPSGFAGTANPPVTPDLWVPLMMQAQIVPGQDWLNDPSALRFQLLGHEVQASSPLKGAAELSVLIHQFQIAHPATQRVPGTVPHRTAVTTRITLERATLFGNTDDPRFLLVVALIMALVAMVLLVACANLANMLLARAAGRQKEIATRMAFGASRKRLVRQLLTESLLLAVMGGASGLVLSVWISDLVRLAAAPFVRGLASIVIPAPDARIFFYALLVSVVTAVVFGLTPALHASATPIVASLNDSAFMGAGFTKSRIRTLFVAGQAAVSMMFLVTACLLAVGLTRSEGVNPGYETKSIYLMGLSFSNDPLQANTRARQAIDRLQSTPEVQDAAVFDFPPMLATWTLPCRGEATSTANPLSSCLANHVSANFFSTLGIPFVLGSNFTQTEQLDGASVAVVSQATAQSLWPGENPVGKKIDLILTRGGPWTTETIIGVVGDVRTANLSRIDPAMVYMPAAEANLSAYNVAIRIRGDARSGLAAVARALAPLDPSFAAGFSPLNLENDVVRVERLISRTLCLSALSLALLALLLAAIGVHGIAAFVVSQRQREIGIRMALGADPRAVLRLILLQGVRPVILGGFIGLLGAFAIMAILRALLVFPGSMDVLYGATRAGALVFFVVPCFLILIALAACYIPARRAMKVDPMAALRYE